jgi:phosphoribosylpyrophosphate synthetase
MSTYCRRTAELDESAASTALPTVVDSADSALAVIGTSIHQPQRAEVIVLLLDVDLRGRTVVIVDGTESPDAVIEVVELLAESAAEAERPVSFVVAAVRPGYGPLPGDADRWLELSEIAETHGCELVEWFVLSDEVAWCPRDLLAEPPRWP